MPRTIQTTVYTLAELKEMGNVAAVERARQWLREGFDYEWWDYAYELWQSALDQVGFTDAKIAFSGFSSQGDGASFTAGCDLDRLVAFLSSSIADSEAVGVGPDGKEDFRAFVVHKCGGVLVNAKFRRLLAARDYISLSVKRTSHHYSHERTCDVEAEFTAYNRADKLESLFCDFVGAVEQLRLDLSRAIYRWLEQEYEAITSDESIDENSAANGYTFTAAGKREG